MNRWVRSRCRRGTCLFSIIIMAVMYLSGNVLIFKSGHTNSLSIHETIRGSAATPKPTELNRTLWDAKSYADFTKSFPTCWNTSQVSWTDETDINRTDGYIRNLLPFLETDWSVLPNKTSMCDMSAGQLEMLYHRYLSTIQTICRKSVRMGKSKDGGWDICADNNWIGSRHCLVYSFGIQFDFSFDDEIADVFGCRVHSFDPSMHMKDHLHSEKVYFYATGIANYDGASDDLANWKMRRLETIRRNLGHWKNNYGPRILKMDIETWEWAVIPEALETNSLKGVEQFLAEFHASPLDDSKSNPRAFWLHKLFILKDLYDVGYRIFWIGRNHQCVYKSSILNKVLYGCYEVSFMRDM